MTKKTLWYAFGLMITVALMFIGLSIFQRAEKTADTLAKGQDAANKNIEEYEIVKFDGYDISGSQAIYYAKEVVGNHGIPVTFKTTLVPAGFVVSDSSLYGEFRDLNSSYYINPIIQYTVEVKRDENDTITGVEITYVAP